MSDTMDLSALSWNNLTLHDKYRSLTPGAQAQVKGLWLRGVAPILHPEMQQDPAIASAIRQQVWQSRAIPFVENEKEVVTPLTYSSFRNWDQVENNSVYAHMDYRDQQAIKAVWFQKMLNEDEEFRQLDAEQQQAYYQRLLERQPSFSRGAAPMQFAGGTGPVWNPNSREQTGLFERPPASTLWSDDYTPPEEEFTGWQKMLGNAVGALATTASALGTWLPTIINENGAVPQYFRDVRKQREWMNAIDKNMDWLTEVGASFVGSAAGFMLGGRWNAYQAFEGVTATLAGKALNIVAPRLPSVVGRGAGASVAGMVHGIAEAITEGRDWNANLITDATIGVGMEFGFRWLGAVRFASRMAKELDIPYRDLIRPAADAGRSVNMSQALEDVFTGNPMMRQLIEEVNLVDQHGLRLKTLYHPSGSGVDMVAKNLELEARYAPDAIEIFDGNNMVFRAEGTRTTQINNAVNWMLNDPKAWEIWEKTMNGKQFMEIVATAPGAEARQFTEIPEIARAHIYDFFELHGQRGYFNRFDMPQERIMSLDDIYTVLRRGNSSTKKIAENLSARGIELDGGGSNHRAAVAQLKAELDELVPESPYFIVNRNSPSGAEPRIVKIADIPVMFIDEPRVNQPVMSDGAYWGNSGHIREVLTNLRRLDAQGQRATTTLLKNRQGQAVTFKNTGVVEVRMTLPDGADMMHDVVIRFNSSKQAEEFLQFGSDRAHKELMEGFFDGTNPGLREQYEEFKKAWKDNPGRYHTDFAPYGFAIEMARQKGMALGNIGGRYVLEGDYIKTQFFDNLNDVYKAIDEMQIDVLPEMNRGISRQAVEEIFPDGIGDPMKAIDKDVFDLPGPRRGNLPKQQGLLTLTGLNFTRPTEFAMQMLEETPGGAWLRNADLSPTKIFNTYHDANRAVTAFINEKDRVIARMTKGLNAERSEFVYRYIEALDNPAERQAMGDLGARFETKAEVHDEMLKKYGAELTTRLEDQAAQIRQYFDEMFNRAGLNWSSFIQHYMPHIRANALKRMTSINSHLFEYTSGLDIPEPDRRAFFEMARETNPMHFIFERDVRRLLGQYTHMVARNSFLRPVMKQMRTQLQAMVDAAKVRGSMDNDYVQIVHYMRNFFDSVDGVHSSNDHLYRLATNNMLGRLAKHADDLESKLRRGEKAETPSDSTELAMLDEAMQQPAKKSDVRRVGRWSRRVGTRSKDITDMLVTWSTGSFIAGRGYPVLRNAMQPFITTAPLVGLDWTLHAYDQLMRPGTMARMEQLGIISRRKIPVAGWAEMDMDSFIKRAVAVGMWPFKEVDAINRTVSYIAGHDRAMHAFRRYIKGDIRTKNAFLVQSGARNYGRGNHAQLADMLNTARNVVEGGQSFADRIGDLTVRRSQWIYENAAQPQMFRKGIGRWFGTFTSWPLNFISYMGQVISPRSGMPIAERVKVAGRLTAILSGITAGIYEAGLNPGSFMPWNMADMQPGPVADLLLNTVKGLGGDREALFGVINTLVKFYPFAGEMSGIYKAVTAAQDGDFYEMALHLLSAPINYEVYPRRDGLLQEQIDGLYKAAAAYSEGRRDTTGLYERMAENVGSIFR